MMGELEKVERAVRDSLHRLGLSGHILWDDSEFLYVGYSIVRLVLAKQAEVDAIRRALADVQQQLAQEGVDFDPQVRARWEFDRAGDLQPLYASDGGLRAASVVPVYLKSGDVENTAHVIFTWAADKAIHDIVPQANLRTVANEVVRDRLTRGGDSAWDPLAEPTIEVNAAAAPYVSRLLQQAA